MSEIDLDKLADEIIRLEFPTYEQAIPPLRNAIMRKKARIKLILERYLTPEGKIEPRPLDLDAKNLIPPEEKQALMIKIAKEGHSFPHHITCQTCEEDFDQVVNLTLKFVKQRIREACEFYLRYKDNPGLLLKEHSKLEKISDRRAYNEWLFKLAFGLK